MPLESMTHSIWFMLFSRFLLAIVAMEILILTIALVRREKMNREFIKAQKEKIIRTKEEMFFKLRQQGIEPPMFELELHASSRRQLNIPHPHLVRYYLCAKLTGLKSEDIKDKMLKSGWPEEEVMRAIKKCDILPILKH